MYKPDGIRARAEASESRGKLLSVLSVLSGIVIFQLVSDGQ
jgi:hypothetical protein